MLLMREDEVSIVEDGPWEIVIVAGWCKDGWASCKVFYHQPAPKNLFQIGVKDGRAARNIGSRMLQEYHPGILQWVVEEVSKSKIVYDIVNHINEGEIE